MNALNIIKKKDIIMGANQINCNNCHNMANSINTSKVIIAPNVLIIKLNRGKGLQFDAKLTFGEYLDIRNFKYYKDSSSYYELKGILANLGPSNMGGHFIASCKNFVALCMYKYNDDLVNLSSFQEASSSGVSYIFFSSIKR